MQAPQVVSRVIIDELCQKIPIDSESRFCSDTCDKQQNYLKYLFYGEWLAFIVGSAAFIGISVSFFEFLDICSTGEVRYNNCHYNSFTDFLFDEFVLSLLSATILGIIFLHFWYFKRLRYVDAKTKVNAEVQKIEQEIEKFKRRKKLEEKTSLHNRFYVTWSCEVCMQPPNPRNVGNATLQDSVVGRPSHWKHNSQSFSKRLLQSPQSSKRCLLICKNLSRIKWCT